MAPGPAGELKRSPDPLAAIWGLLLREGGREGRRKGAEGREEGREEGYIGKGQVEKGEAPN